MYKRPGSKLDLLVLTEIAVFSTPLLLQRRGMVAWWIQYR